MTVSIIIPNWNGRKLLQKFIPFVVTASAGVKITIIDDCSSDDSIQYIKTYYPNISLLSKRKHDGYASTVNFGVKHAHSDIVVLLNNDIKPEKGFLKPLIDHFSDPCLFAVGCMDKSIEKNGSIALRGRGIAKWRNGFYIHSRGEVNQHDTAWVSGGSGAFRKNMWEKLGGMDERFNPFYWEDIDLSFRAVRAGYKILFEPASVVWHYHEIGKIKSEYSESDIQKISYRNQFLFLWKNSPIQQRCLQCVFIPIYMIKSLFHSKNMIFGFFSSLLRYYSSA
jgi:GT2 family glycosyltransferase